MKEKVTFDVSNTKVGKAMINIEEKYINLFKETVAADRNAPLTREQMAAFLKDFDALDSDIYALMLSHSMFYALANRMNELVEEYGLDDIEGKVFPAQLKAFKDLLNKVKILGNYYNEASS